MRRKLRIAYVAHTLRSDWNNGNAHFLRGLMRAMGRMGHDVVVLEPETEWSIENLREETAGERSLLQFAETYSDLKISTYRRDCPEPERCFRDRLRGRDIVILHEWNSPELAQMLLAIRQQLGYRLLFHDTHHRASSSPEQMQRFGLKRFDGIVTFGEALSDIYRDRFGLEQVWTLHEAADTTVFKPHPEVQRQDEVVWVGNWGDDERAAEIREFLLQPAAALKDAARTTIYGVRFPDDALRALAAAGVQYGGYLPNLDAPLLYARAKATVHVPRQQYTGVMKGIPTIRVFEALACGVPLVSAPWEDSEELFRAGDLRWATNTAEMTAALRTLMTDKAAAEDQALRGLETVLSRHTCKHRAKELTDICEEVMA
jgi:spore maturation protein CgeB